MRKRISHADYEPKAYKPIYIYEIEPSVGNYNNASVTSFRIKCSFLYNNGILSLKSQSIVTLDR